MEIGRYKTLGEISKGFLSALDIKYNVKKFERLSKEEKVDLEILSSETSSYLNDYSLKEYDLVSLVNEKFQEGYLWMSEHYYKDFNQIFKKENFYETEKKENLKNRYFSSSFLHKNTVPNLDLKKLNKKYYFCERERTQLEIFSMIPGDNIVYKENIEKLLEKMDEENNKGEKYDLVNFVNSTSQTPLIGAISAHNYDVALILLERKEITRTINQKSLRKKVTALSQFFLFLLEGNIEKNFKVIEKTLLKLIERGVDLNQKCTLDDCYPIQLIMNYIYSEQKKDLDYEEIIKKITNPETKNIYRRELYGSPFQKYFDKDLNKESVEKSGLPLFYIENNKHIPEIVKKNKDKLLRLIEIMLINGADVDLKWKKGISPIMYASEIGDLELFMLLSKYTKNIFQTTDKGLGLLTNSRGYGNDKVAEYLIKNYDSNKFSFYEIINNAIKSL